jgi:hypothetical protein
MLLLAVATPVDAAGCSFEPQGEGRVTEVIDIRTFRLQDGREVRLAGIEPAVSDKTNRAAALAAIIAGREVTLRGEDDSPDRYGQQPAWCSSMAPKHRCRVRCWRTARRLCRAAY